MALVQQTMDFRFPWYQQAGSAQAPPESSAGTASQPQAQAQHQQQSADVEREFQAAMQFYSRGGGSGGDERLRLCQEPLVPYKPLASGSQSKSQKQQQQQQQPATEVKSRRPSKDGAVQTDLSLPLPAWSPGPTPLTALLGASVDSKDGEGAVEELQRERQPRQPALRRSSSFVELTTRPTAGDSAGRPPSSPSIRRPRTPPASILRKEQAAAAGVPSDLGDAPAGADRLSGAPSGARRAEHHGTGTTACLDGLSHGAPFPARATRKPPAGASAVFRRFAPPQPGSEPVASRTAWSWLERARAQGPVASRASFHLRRPAQASLPASRSRCTIRCRRSCWAPNADDATDPAADPAAVDTLRNLERDQWRSQYSRSFTGRGQEFPVALIPTAGEADRGLDERGFWRRKAP
uniref:Uncharacterized protein n=1 Tax=Macrostomum lignano TaxID=282301 RepID=A0A1I8F758_9PLAT